MAYEDSVANFSAVSLAYVVDQEKPGGPAKQPMNMVLTLEFEPTPHWGVSSAPTCDKNVLHQLFF